MKSVLASEDRASALGEYYASDKVNAYKEIIAELGEIDDYICKQNHDSPLFDTVACYTTFAENSVALVWEFYFFNDQGVWVGTNMVVIQEIEDHHCIKGIKFIGFLGAGVEFDSTECN